jgi:hypothetical protein
VHIGERFKDGRYTVTQKLGWGHFSTVWMVADNETGGLGAMKIVKSASHYTDAARDEITLLTQVRKRARARAVRTRSMKMSPTHPHTHFQSLPTRTLQTYPIQAHRPLPPPSCPATPHIPLYPASSPCAPCLHPLTNQLHAWSRPSLGPGA